MEKPYQAMPDVEVLAANFPIPGMGFLPVNSFVIKAKEPVLVDTGMGIDSEEFIKALESVIDPQELRWIWLTHDDADHTGNIEKVLEAAPDARLVVNCLASLRMSTAWRVPMHRLYWLNSGESIDAGDRELTALRPPLFDNPTTIALYDNKSEAFFSADCFGALIPAAVQDADDVAEGDLTQGMTAWASLDNPWIYMVEPDTFRKTLNTISQMAPKMIFSAHLPPARGKTEQLLEILASVSASSPAVAPNQSAFVQMFSKMRVVS